MLRRANFLFLRHSKEIFVAREYLSRAHFRQAKKQTEKSRESGKILLTPGRLGLFF
jgi:hypothetical protein